MTLRMFSQRIRLKNDVVNLTQYDQYQLIGYIELCFDESLVAHRHTKKYYF